VASTGPSYPKEDTASGTCPSETENPVLTDGVGSHEVTYPQSQ